MYGPDLSIIWDLFRLMFVALIFFAAYSIYAFFFKGKVVKTTSKPSITWELKADGQKVDTVFIYTFK